MNLTTKKIIFIFITFFLSVQGAFATQEDEAWKLVDKAIAHIEANGVEKAKSDFMDRNGAYQTDELFVFVISFDGVMLTHARTGALNGRNVMNLKDPKGNFFVKDMIDAAKANPEKAETEYMWTHSETKKLSRKLAHIKKVPSMDVLVAVGVYQ
ncbi:cache domain-containing protein [Shewanella sp. A14]